MVIKRRKLLLIVGSVLLLLLLGFITFGLMSREEVPTLSPIYIGNTGDNAVAFMVNVDWGQEILPDMLKVFQDNNVKVTFFVTGRFAGKFPEITKMLAGDGHEIGNHGYSHPHPDNISLEENVKEIMDTENVFKELAITGSKLFAPAYGEHKEHVLKAADSLGYKTIMWTADTIDWQEPSPDTIIKRVLTKADNGTLILMHPKKCTLTALPPLITALKEQGFQLKTVSELIQ